MGVFLVLFAGTCLEGIHHEGADGHGTYAAWNGGDVGAFGGYFVELDVAAEAEAFRTGRVGDAGGADVDDYCAFLDHVGGDELRLADGCDDDVGLSAFVLEGGRVAVAYGDGGVADVLLDHELCHGFADNIGTAEDDTLLA